MKIAKMARENFSIRALYNITKNQHNPIKTVGRDSFLSIYKFLLGMYRIRFWFRLAGYPAIFCYPVPVPAKILPVTG